MTDNQPDAENKTESIPEILVPIDNSPSSRAAADAAAQLAAAGRMVIHGIYVIDAVTLTDPYVDVSQELPLPASSASAADPLDLLERQGNEALRWLKDRCADAGVPAVTDLEAGGIIEVIEAAAARAALLSIGRRGYHHADDPDWLGRHLRTIAHHVHRPTLVGGEQERSLRHLLLGYHGRNHAADALEWAVKLQGWLNAPVDVVVAWEDEDAPSRPERAAAIRQELTAQGLEIGGLLAREGQPAPVISAAAEETQADLIIIGGYRRHALVEWLVGNTVDRILRSTALPVLIAWPVDD
jgi:nucleotide-binding universal stress UspA family protein